MSHSRIFQYSIYKPDNDEPEIMDADSVYQNMNNCIDYVKDDQDALRSLIDYLKEIPFEEELDGYFTLPPESVRLLENRIRIEWSKKLEEAQQSFNRLRRYASTGIYNSVLAKDFYAIQYKLKTRFEYYFFDENVDIITEEELLVSILSDLSLHNQPLYIVASFNYHY